MGLGIRGRGRVQTVTEEAGVVGLGEGFGHGYLGDEEEEGHEQVEEGQL